MSQLELKSLTKSYGAVKIFDDLNLDVTAGEIVVIFGGSGTGKTILLRLVAGVEVPTSGTINLMGQDATDVAPEHRGVGMAFQNFALFPHMSAADNIAAPLRAQKSTSDAVKSGVDRVAKLLKIEHVLGHSPKELSNGQKQRTALARALAAQPKILLLDDPLRNVDAKLRYEMRLELPRLLRESGAAVLYVTQDYKEAMALADRIAVLAGGKFVQVAAPDEIYLHPATLNVAKLFGDPSINTAETTLMASGNRMFANIHGAEVALPNVAAAGQKVVLGVRPEAVILSSNGNGMECEVVAVTPLNERIVLLLKSAGGWEFLSSLPSSTSPPAPGAKLRAGFEPSGTHVFDATTGARLHG